MSLYRGGRHTWRRWLGVLLAGLMLIAPAAARAPVQNIAGISVSQLPPEARYVLTLIKRSGPFPYKRDAVTFFNRERLLPSRPRGYYTEYTVPTPGVSHRGARRIVAGKGDTGDPATSGEYWYTADHYASFKRIRE